MTPLRDVLPPVALAVAIGLVGALALLHWAEWLLPWVS